MEVFTSIFERIDSVVLQQIAGKSTELMNVMSPILSSGFAIYVILIFLSYWQGSSPEQTMVDLIKRVATWAVIIGFSINIGTYNDTVVPIVLKIGDNLSQALVGNTVSSSSALDALATQIVDIVNQNSKAAWETKGIAGKIGAVINATFNNAIVLICSSLFLVVAGAYIVLTKVFLALLAVTGHVFIACALFPATRQFFNSWFNQVVNYSFLMLFINVTGGFFLDYINSVLTDMVSAQTSNPLASDAIALTSIIHVGISCLLFLVILLKLPELTSGLTGGVASNGFGNLVNSARMLKQLGSKGSSKKGGIIGKA